MAGTDGLTLQGGVALVTGAASGIGRALSEGLANRGAEVVLADRQIGLAEEVASQIRKRGGRATACELDVRSSSDFEALARETRSRTGRIDYLFNNAGIGIGGEIRNYTIEDWDDVIDVNLRGITNGIQAIYPMMIEQGFGHIVNTASVAGLVVTGLLASYTATKHAVVALSKVLRAEAKAYGLRVSVVCPGVIRTPILLCGKYGRNKTGVSNEEVATRFERLWPMDANLFADRVIADVARNRAIIIHPRRWRILWYLERIAPVLGVINAGRMAEEVRRNTSG